MLIYRELKEKIVSLFASNQPKGLILSGIVGAGKTTLIETALEDLKKTHQIHRYTGDDVQFRNAVLQNSNFLLRDIQSESKQRHLIFVDEVQKSDAIFDALKIVFDQEKVSFIVSGSNPQYLATVARKRLQRRADQWTLLPISIKELLIQSGDIPVEQANRFQTLILNADSISEDLLSQVETPKSLQKITENYLQFGGLPLVLLTENTENKLREIRLVCERGFDLMSHDNHGIADVVRSELALLNSQEFTYKNIMNKTRIRRREIINQIIDELMNHGYIFKKRPILFSESKTSYLSVFSFVDPGITRYLRGHILSPSELGFQLEAYIHSHLQILLENSPYKATYGYFKPYLMDGDGHIRYQQGEIDFVIQRGKELIPMEVKLQEKWNLIDVSLISTFIKDHKCPFGIVIYGGKPKLDSLARILYWPYWLI